MRPRWTSDQPPRPPWTAAVLGASLLTLERPGSWVPSLAGFLARGGILAFLLPILVLPTPAGLQAELAPLLVPFVFGQPAAGLLRLLAGVVVLGVAALILGGLLGAWSDRLLIREAAAAPGGAIRTSYGEAHEVVHVLGARLLAHVPLAVALAWGAVRIGEVFYREVTVPFEVATPVAIRVATAVPESIAVILGAWLLGESAGGIAAREVVLRGRSGAAAAAIGWLGLVRRPLASAATILATTVVLVLAVVPAVVAATAAWSRLRSLLWDDAPASAVAVALGLFVVLWLGGLVLAAGATAWRSAVWTREWERHACAGVADPEPEGSEVPLVAAGAAGTIGADARRPGGWPTAGTSGRL
jgi:hypothetical protein